MTNLSPRVLAIIPSIIPSTIMVAIKPLTELSSCGRIQCRISLEGLTRTSDLDWADVVVFSRNCEDQYLHILDYLIEQQKPFIYDLDDNFFALPKDTTFSEHYYNRGLEKVVEKYVVNAYRVRVYSKALYNTIQPMNKNVQLVAPPLNWSLISRSPDKAKSEDIKIVYATSRNQDSLAKIFVPALTRVLQTNNHVKAYFLGFCPEELKRFGNVRHWPFINNYDQYMLKFSTAGFDIGLAPLIDDLFHASKTNAKFRDYASCRIAGVYSDVDIYRDCVSNGETGLLVPNTENDWFEALQLLVNNRSLREKIKEQAYQYAAKKYSWDEFLNVWHQMAVDVVEEASHRKIDSPIPAATVNKPVPTSTTSLAQDQKPAENRLKWVLRKTRTVFRMFFQSPISEWGHKIHLIVERLSMILYLRKINRQAKVPVGDKQRSK